MAEAVENQCQGPRDPFVQLPEVTDIFCDCLEPRKKKQKNNNTHTHKKNTCSKKMPVCNRVNKDQRRPACLFSVSGLSSPLKSLTALVKRKQKSLL